MTGGINMTQVKRQNQSLVLKYLNKKGPLSRKDVAVGVGLTQASVTNICNELISDGLVHEVGVDDEAKGVGRRKVFIDIDYSSRYLISINIEVDLSTVALCDMAGKIISRNSIKTDCTVEPAIYLSKLCDIAKSFIERQSSYEKSKISAVSVGIVGPVDRKLGISLHAYGIWDKPVHIKEIIESYLPYSCILENNVTAITKATMLLGIGRKYENLHIIKWGPGVGSAVVINGQIFEGINGRAAELGHIIIDKDGDRCSCGRRGCLETRVSINALNRITKFEKEDFYEVYKNSSGLVRNRFDEAIDIFARCIANAMTMLAPENVLLSGYLFKEKEIQNIMIKACKKYLVSIEKSKIMANNLIDREDYIGPVGTYLFQVIG